MSLFFSDEGRQRQTSNQNDCVSVLGESKKNCRVSSGILSVYVLHEIKSVF